MFYEEILLHLVPFGVSKLFIRMIYILMTVVLFFTNYLGHPIALTEIKPLSYSFRYNNESSRNDLYFILICKAHAKSTTLPFPSCRSDNCRLFCDLHFFQQNKSNIFFSKSFQSEHHKVSKHDLIVWKFAPIREKLSHCC